MLVHSVRETIPPQRLTGFAAPLNLFSDRLSSVSGTCWFLCITVEAHDFLHSVYLARSPQRTITISGFETNTRILSDGGLSFNMAVHAAWPAVNVPYKSTSFIKHLVHNNLVDRVILQSRLFTRVYGFLNSVTETLNIAAKTTTRSYLCMLHRRRCIQHRRRTWNFHLCWYTSNQL